MLKNLPEISKQIFVEDILHVLENKYSSIGTLWAHHQMEWSNDIFSYFNDHDKFLIIIYLTKKTLDLYSKNFVRLSYDQFYSKDAVEIEKFNVIEVSKNINIPKESARRKIVELEKANVIKRYKNKIIINKSAFSFVSPISSIKRVSHFLSIFSKTLVDEKILLKPLRSTELEKIIKKNFSFVLKIYYEMQIPMLLNYKKVFKDLESFHIWGLCVVNQHLHFEKKNKKMEKKFKMNKLEFIKSIYSNDEIQGINAMSISNISGIPRATVVRKLKKLVKQKHLTIDDKKHYRITGSFVKELIPIQNIVLNQLAIFSTKIYNLVTL